MKVFVALLSLVAVASAGQTFLGGAYGGLAAPVAYGAGVAHTGQSVSQRAEDGLGNYQFAYQEQHGTGGTARSESGDVYGRKQGSYSLGVVDGRQRTVNYVADEFGFRAQIVTNEPGTASQQPADVAIHAAPQAVAHVAAPVAPVAPVAPIVAPRPVIQAPIYQAPIVQKQIVAQPVFAPRPIVQAPIYQAPIVQKQIVAQPIVQQHVVAAPVVQAPIVQKQIVAHQPVFAPRPVVQAPLYAHGYGYGLAAPHAYGSVVKHIAGAPGVVGAYGLGAYGAGLGYTHGLAATGLGLGAVYGAPLYVK